MINSIGGVLWKEGLLCCNMACIGYCVWDFRMCGGGLGNDVVVVSGRARVWGMMIGV